MNHRNPNVIVFSTIVMAVLVDCSTVLSAGPTTPATAASSEEFLTDEVIHREVQLWRNHAERTATRRLRAAEMLSHPEVATNVQLSPPQAKRIAEIFQDYAAKVEATFDATNVAQTARDGKLLQIIDKLNLDRNFEILQVLTQHQRTELDKLLDGASKSDAQMSRKFQIIVPEILWDDERLIEQVSRTA